ncbi:BON domain-containing protein [Streptomyces poonensis]|uniref:BON domain-containing protein n=1 Tax=Streptomyces poonensis TaxID=68255 RepID=A0A918ULM1_9ACTN|nr:BON domain-containing protein [Streptomyces poonensis]GGZ20682.1 hypothetical protein GCM10010365_46240 [Streptomyces poonensis]
MTANPAHPVSGGERVHALLTDGTTVCIRPAGTGDQEAVLRLYRRMSDANLRLRFFTVSRRSAEQAATRIAGPAKSGHRALVATHGRDRIIGIAEYETTALWLTPHAVDVDVHEGVVTLTGRLERRSDVTAAVHLCRGTDGVVAVVDHLTYRFDDSRLRPEEPHVHGVTDDWLRKL